MIDLTAYPGPAWAPNDRFAYWNVRVDEAQPPDLVGTMEEIRTFRDLPASVEARQLAAASLDQEAP